MPDPEILETIDALADLSSDAAALRCWLARLHAGYQLTDRDRAAVARHIAGVRDHADAVLAGASLLGIGP